MKSLRAALPIAFLIILLCSSAVHATVNWNWSFANETGTFITDGDLSNGLATAGNYALQDFSVTSSTTGGTIGSLLGGQYNTTQYSTYQPFSFDWNGLVVTQWNQSGANTFDWWAFGDNSNADISYFFGWDTGNVNDPTKAAHYSGLAGINQPLAVGTVSVSAGSASVPEPTTMLLFGTGLAGFGLLRKRFKL